jgi:uncharacterized phiE125 gp8 family phage protein
MILVSLEQPSVHAVSLEQAKAHLRVDHANENDLIDAYVKAVNAEVETFLGRALITQRWALKINSAFPRTIELPLPPCQSVQSIMYLDASGDLKTLEASDYALSGLNGDCKAEIAPAPGKSWPRTLATAEAITVAFTAGYPPSGESPADPAANVPAPIKAAILELVATRYAYRESVTAGQGFSSLPISARSALDDFRVWGF